MAKLAFYTYGILEETKGRPHSKGFIDRVPDVFESAERSDGFIDRDRARSREDASLAWGDPDASPRYTKEQWLAQTGDSTVSPIILTGPDSYEAATLSLWDDLESVYAFAYNGRHFEALKKRAEWFVKPEWPTYVAWWVEDGETPTREDAAGRLEHLHDKGSTPHAFDFKTPFDASGTPWKMDRPKIQEHAKTVKEFDEDNPKDY
ncbi:MAG: DUF3291 domain-containing protein [Chloroflexi bacterium]|nr:DUF3291 domain-containing protein [Chloroflexota bacterium]